MDRQGEITAMSEKYQIDVTCIQEHRIHHSEKTEKHQGWNVWMSITSSAEKAENNVTFRGVGVLVIPRAYGSLLDVEPLSPKIMVATLNKNPKTTIFSCFSPINCSDKIEVVEFYRMLQDIIRQLPMHNVVIFAGDMNAQSGSEDTVGFSCHDTTNRNGNLLLDLTKECGLESISTTIQKKKAKLDTYISQRRKSTTRPYPHQQEVEIQCNGLPVLQHDVLCTV